MIEMFGRELAPISAGALSQIDSQAAATLRENLAGRKFADVKGPYGWTFAGVFSGRLGPITKEGEVGIALRETTPLVETRIEFELSAFELHNADRGCPNPDLVAVERAALSAAAFEDKAVFEGLAPAGIKGLAGGSENSPLELPRGDADGFVSGLIDEIGRLKRTQSISGPFALVGGHEISSVLNRLAGNRTLLGLLEKYSEVDEFIYAAGAKETYLVSKRGGDFELTLGGDFQIGYSGREGDALKFFLAESFSFRVLEPRAYTPVKLL